MEDFEKEIVEAINLANAIYKILQDPKLQEMDGNERHNLILKKYPSFSNAYPLVVKYMAKDLKYNENAFRKLLNKLRKDPGKGMKGFIERQAEYAKFWYIESCKKLNKHIDMKEANKYMQLEYNHMSKQLKKIEKEQELAENEFDKEYEKNLESKKKELLDFIKKNQPEPIIIELSNRPKSELILIIRKLMETIKQKNINYSLPEIDQYDNNKLIETIKAINKLLQ